MSLSLMRDTMLCGLVGRHSEDLIASPPPPGSPDLTEVRMQQPVELRCVPAGARIEEAGFERDHMLKDGVAGGHDA